MKSHFKIQVSEDNGEWNIRRTTTIFYRLVKLRYGGYFPHLTPTFTTKTRAVDFKFRIGERFDEVTPDKREVRYNKVSFTNPHLLFQYKVGNLSRYNSPSITHKCPCLN